MGSAGALLIYRTEIIFKNIILFWTLCALDKACAAPIKNLHCNKSKMGKNIFAGIHAQNNFKKMQGVSFLCILKYIYIIIHAYI